MATLSSALNYALAGLSVSASRSSLVSKNVGFASDENYTRKSADVYTLPGGAPAVAGYSRSIDKQLLESLLASTSDSAANASVLKAANLLGELVGDPANSSSVSALLSKFQDRLRAFESSPSSSALASAAVDAAQDVAIKLNQDSQSVSRLRSDAQSELVESIGRVNSLLSQFKVINDSIVRGSGTAAELSENLDQRDAILKLLSEEIGIRAVTRARNDVMIYAAGGAVLFEGTPRGVTLAPPTTLDGSGPAGPVLIDGVPVTGTGSPMPLRSGRVFGLTQIRDELAPKLLRQLDGIAASLVENFRETGQSSSSLPDMAGLFIDRSVPRQLPLADLDGLAARIGVDGTADPDQGGNPFLLRDGGFSGSAYVYNAQGNSGFSVRLAALSSSFDLQFDFDPASGLGGRGNLIGMASASASWIEGLRQNAQDAGDQTEAKKVRARESLLRVTGVSIDQEMAVLLELERSYQASSKIITVVDSMYATLMEAVR